jgi:hypothetical protein
MNVFFGPDAVAAWEKMIGLTVVEIIDGETGTVTPSKGIEARLGRRIELVAVGQSVAVLEKPAGALESQPQ